MCIRDSTYWAPEQLLAVPLSTYRYTYDEVTIDGRTYTYSGYEFVSTLELIDVDVESGTLSTHGMVNHSEFYNEGGLSGWWGGSTSIRRSIFMGDYVYAFSTAGASVHSTDDLELMVEIEIPGYDEPEVYYYDDEGDATDPEEEEGPNGEDQKEDEDSATVEG